MASPVHRQPAPYYYSQGPPPSSHSPQHHSHSHSHSQASTPFTTASSAHSPPLSHQLTHPTTAIGYPPFNPYPEHPTSNGHSQSYSSSATYHPSAAAPYDGYGANGHNALQLQPPPRLDTSMPYHPSVPSAAGAGSATYIPARPSPLQHSHSQRMIPGVQQLSGRGQPASATHPPPTGQTITGVNALPPIGSNVSGVSPGASAPATNQGQSAPAATSAVVGSDGQPVRKRPKYTRSKAGCLVCRQKKVKCDEKKPTCTRCLHGHRECSWPKDVPTAANRNKAPKSLRGVERDAGDVDIRSDNVDDDDDEDSNIPQSADPATTSFSPVQPSAVSSYAGETATNSGGFGAPGVSYSYPYGGQGSLRQPVAQTITSQAHSRNTSSGSSGVVGYNLGAPEAGPEPLAPYFRTGQERNLVGYETISIPISNPLPSAPSLSSLPTRPSHSPHHSVPSWTQAPLISFDSYSPSPSSVSPSSSSSFDVSSLLPSPASSFSAPAYSSHGLTVPGMSPTSSTSSGSPYAAPQASISGSGLEWLRLEDFPAPSVGYQ